MERRIDHVVVESADEQALFDFFTGTLGLPVAWPVAQWGYFHEGAACAGDTNIGCNRALDPRQGPAPAIRAIALDPGPDLDVALKEIDAHGIGAYDPMPSPDLSLLPEELIDLPWASGWTVAAFKPWRDGAPAAFACRYNHDCATRRARDVERLRAEGGGCLAITRLREVVVASTDPATDADRWRVLLGDQPDGPGVTVVDGAADGYQALVFEVASIAKAADALGALGIAHDRGDALRIDPADALGLDLRICEA